MKDNLKLVTVATTTFPAMAEIIRSTLEAGGFDAYVINANAATYVGLAFNVEVQVETSQAEAAKKYLEENRESIPITE